MPTDATTSASDADGWAGEAIREEQVQDKEAATAARLEGLLLAACASPVEDWGLQGSVALPSYAVSPATHPTDMAASSCPVQEGGEWPLQLFAAARKRAAASYDGDVLAYLTQLASVEAEHARALQALNARLVRPQADLSADEGGLVAAWSEAAGGGHRS